MLVCELCGLYAIQPGGELVQREVPLTSIGQIVEFLTQPGRHSRSARPATGRKRRV